MDTFKDRMEYLDAIEELERKTSHVMAILAASYDTVAFPSKAHMKDEAKTALEEAQSYGMEINAALSQHFLDSLPLAEAHFYNMAIDNLFIVDRIILENDDEITAIDPQQVLRDLAFSTVDFKAEKKAYEDFDGQQKESRPEHILFTINRDDTFRALAFAICRQLGPHKPLIFLVTAHRLYLKTSLHPALILSIFNELDIASVENDNDAEAGLSFAIQSVGRKTARNWFKSRRYLKQLREELSEE